MRRLIAAVVLLVVVALVALTQGAADIPPATVLRILLDRLPLITVDVTVPVTQETIVLDIRLPRVLAAGAVGAALAHLRYGTETRHVALFNTVPEVVSDVNTSNNVFWTHALVRVQPRTGSASCSPRHALVV